MAIVEKIIQKISPVWALKRARANALLSIMASEGFTPNSAYTSGTTNLRALGTWLPNRGSAMSELNDYTRSLQIARSSDSYKNNAIATAVIKRNRTSVVGTGLRLQSRIDYKTLGISREEASEKQREIETLYRVWSENPDECDIERTLNIYFQQAVVLIQSLIAGDIFLFTPEVRYPGRIFNLKRQVIEGDRISNPNGMPDTKRLRSGVELGSNGEPVAIHVLQDHPGDFLMDGTPYVWKRHNIFGAQTGRRRILHIYDKDRAQLYRGCPYLSPIMETIKQIGRYKDSEIMAALIASFFTVFIKSQSQVKPFATAPDSTSASTKGVETNANASDELLLGEGLINMLAPGDDIIVADPHRPNKDAAPFIDMLLREVGAATEIPFEVLLQHFSASYSASRAALIEAWRYFLVRRAQLAMQDCQPTYELFFDECVASGMYSAPGYGNPLLRAAWTRASWVGPARGEIDELRHAQASTERMKNGTSNEAIECDELARDRDEVFAQRIYEMQTRKEAEINEDTNEQIATTPLLV